MRFIELFAGIGGFRLGLERAGHKCVWANELDPYCCAVYRKRWPDQTLFEGDIRSVDPRTVPAHDLLCAGFPCQPFSLAGKRKANDDDRFLWPEIVRFIRANRQRFVLLENVPGLLSAGMGTVLGDLALCRYDAEWDLFSASEMGAPHFRQRVFILAYPNEKPMLQAGSIFDKKRGIDHARGSDSGIRWRQMASPNWDLPESYITRTIDGIPGRVDASQALGNAIVPQITEWIGRRLKEIEGVTEDR